MIVTRPVTSNYSSLERGFAVLPGSGSLKSGQILDAVVLSNSDQGHVNLRIGNSVLSASTRIVLQQNARLMLEVIQTHPQLLLRPISTTTDGPVSRPLQDALIALLPQQAGLAPSLAVLIQRHFKNKALGQHQLPGLLYKLESAIPGRNSMIHADGVRQAILQSGLYLETILARFSGKKPMNLSRDLKVCLLRLIQGLEHYKQISNQSDPSKNKIDSYAYNSTTPPRNKGLPVLQARAAIVQPTVDGIRDDGIPDMLSRAQGALARLGLLQVLSAENFNDGHHIWQVEIPVKHMDSVEMVSMSIKNDSKDSKYDNDREWIINLALDLPELGAIHIRISVFSQAISTSFWSESANTRALIESRFEQLRSNLERRGVTKLNLCCQAGKPDDTPDSDTNDSVLDLMA